MDGSSSKLTTRPFVVRQRDELRAIVREWKQAGQTVGLVPTMGALHAGHLSLVERIGQEADRKIVSIFINPTQFGEGEDLDQYPRNEIADLDSLAPYKVDLVYAPGVEQIYPDGFVTTVKAGDLAKPLCGVFRPGHFDGVATVVAKLFAQTAADVAVFGEKDFQQLAVIRRMAADLDIPVRVLGSATVREPDGLAASSRNAYLSDADRQAAAALPATLADISRRALDGEPMPVLESEARAKLLDAGFAGVDYVEFRDSETLAPASRPTDRTRIFAAARIGGTRLIDNMALTAFK